MDELTSASRAYIDSNIWIYYIEGNRQFVAAVRELFDQIAALDATIVTNEIAIAECIYKPAAQNNSTLVETYLELFYTTGIEISRLDGALAIEAARVGGRSDLKLVDAIHLTSAIENNCTVFITGDTRFKTGPAMKVITI